MLVFVHHKAKYKVYFKGLNVVFVAQKTAKYWLVSVDMINHD